MKFFKWRRDLERPLITPQDREALKAEADAKLESARQLQESVSVVANSLKERNRINHYALGIAEAYGYQGAL